MEPIEPILERIGLTKGESKVYLALLQLGSSSTGPIAERSKVSASKVYQILDRLVKKGLVSYITNEKARLYVAQDPKKLIDFLDEEETRIKINKDAVSNILPQLELMKSSGTKDPVAQVLEGKRGFMTAHDKLIDSLPVNGKYHTLTIGPSSRTFMDYFREFNKRREEKNITMWIIYRQDAWPLGKEKEIERKERKGYHPKLCPADVFIPIHITLAGDACLLCMVSDKIVSILINNKYMVDGFKKYFEYIWSISKTPEGYPEFKGKLF